MTKSLDCASTTQNTIYFAFVRAIRWLMYSLIQHLTFQNPSHSHSAKLALRDGIVFHQSPSPTRLAGRSSRSTPSSSSNHAPGPGTSSSLIPARHAIITRTATRRRVRMRIPTSRWWGDGSIARCAWLGLWRAGGGFISLDAWAELDRGDCWLLLCRRLRLGLDLGQRWSCWNAPWICGLVHLLLLRCCPCICVYLWLLRCWCCS